MSHGTIKKLNIQIDSLFLHCRELGDNVNEEELKAMIDEFDLDGDGESNKTSFFKLSFSI